MKLIRIYNTLIRIINELNELNFVINEGCDWTFLKKKEKKRFYY